MGAIIGGVIGGVAAFSLILFLYLFYRRRRRSTVSTVSESVPADMNASKEEIPVKQETLASPSEIGPGNPRYELAATRFSVYELDAENQKM